MLRRKKPHPRSLDALFPKPKPVRVKRCVRGHTQTPEWRPMHGCAACGLYDEAGERIRNRNGAKEREDWSRRHRSGPVLRHLVVSTGRVVTNAIPSWAQQLKKRQDAERRRRPRRRLRVSSAA